MAATTTTLSVSAVRDLAACEEVACAAGVIASPAQGVAAARAPGAKATLAERAVHVSVDLQRFSGVSVNAEAMALSAEERRWLCKRQKIDDYYQLAQLLKSRKMPAAAEVVMKLAVGVLEEGPQDSGACGTAARGDAAAPSFPALASRTQ